MSVRHGTSAILMVVAAALGGCVAAPVVPAAPVAAPAAVAAPAVVAAPAAAACTLPGFLGLTPVCAAVGQEVQHKVAFFGQYFPCLEPKPPLLTLTDPANLASPVPAIAAAAEIKAEQDMAPQKIKALKYLATIGCGGCYAGVEEAFLSALDDCTEEVRFAAVEAIYMTAGSPCVHCNSKGCCSPKIRKRLEEIAFEGSPCPKEPSARVRRMARVALNACGAPAPIELPPLVPTEVIPETPTEPIPAPPPEPVAATPPEQIRQKPVQTADSSPAPTADVSTPLEPKRIAKSVVVPPFEAEDAPAPGVPQAVEVVAATDPAERGDRASRASSLGDGRPTVSDDELLLYYASRLDRYGRPEEVRWESVSAPLSRFTSAEHAKLAMTYMRRRALGEDAAAPDGFRPELVTARRHGWTRREQVASEPVAAALFEGPVGSVSELLTDGEQLILVRVVERHAAGAAAFAEVADQVRKDFLAEQALETLIPAGDGEAVRPASNSQDESDFESPPTESSRTDRPEAIPVGDLDGAPGAITQTSYSAAAGDGLREGSSAASSTRQKRVMPAVATSVRSERNETGSPATAPAAATVPDPSPDIATQNRRSDARPSPVVARLFVEVAARDDRAESDQQAENGLGSDTQARYATPKDSSARVSTVRSQAEYGMWQTMSAAGGTNDETAKEPADDSR